MLTPCGTGVRGRVARHRGADPADRAASSSSSRSGPGCCHRRSPRRWRRPTSGCRAAGCSLNIVTGAEPAELARFGDCADKDDALRAHRRVPRGACGARGRGEPFDFDGTHYRVEGATTRAAPDPVPPIYFGGASAGGRAGRRPPRRRVPRVGRAARRWWPSGSSACGALAADAGPHAALRHPLPRHHPADRRPRRWAVADRLLGRHGPGRHRRRAGRLRADRSPRASGGWPRCTATATADRPSLEIHPNVWAGVGLVRGGAGTALVGSHEEVADRIAEYHGARLRRVHPVRLPAPRGGLLVRRGRDARCCGAGLVDASAARRRRRAGLDVPLTTRPGR